MMDIFETIKALCAPPGVSGAEHEAARAALELLSPYGEGQIDPVSGSVIFRRAGWEEGRPVLLLDAHIDEIGLTVTHITPDGFLKAAPVGGVDARVFPAQRLTVYGTASGEVKKLTCFAACVPPHLSSGSAGVPEVTDLLLDTGLSKEELEKYVALGDRALIENEAVRLLGDRVTSKALDDRSGCAALILALDMLKDKTLGCNIAVQLTSQEEVGERGAGVSAFNIAPDEAIAVDVSFADAPGEKPEDTSPLGSGVMIGISPSLSRAMSLKMKEIAREAGIPFTMEVMGETTGTNADAIGQTRGGVPAVTLSIPERNMHTPVEVVSLRDVEDTARLIAEYAGRRFGEV